MSAVLPLRGNAEYFALLEIAGTRLSTDPRVYSGSTWNGALGRFPVPRAAFRTRAGIQPSERLTVSISDPDRSYEALAETWYGQTATLTLRTQRTFIDGSDGSFQYVLSMQVVGYDVSGAMLELKLADAELAAWDTLFPANTWTTDDFSDLYPDSQGITIPETVGFGSKVPCARLQDEPTVYGICLLGTLGLATVNAVYRDGAVMATDQAGQLLDTNGDLVATVGTLVGASTGITVVTLTFENFIPANIRIEADYDGRTAGGNDRNVSTEISRIMAEAGLTIDPTSKAASVAESLANQAFLDHVYTRQRTTKAIVEEYLEFARANLEKGPAGDFLLVHDKAMPLSDTYNEPAGELVEWNGHGREERPSKVIVQYGTNPENRNEFFHTIERAVVGGTGGDPIPYQVPYCSTWNSVDRYAAYLAKRAEYNRHAAADIYAAQFALGDRIHITPSHGPSIDWTIRQIDRDPNSNALSLQEYNDDVYVYVAGTQPTDPAAPFQPDYSNTRPAAPTSLGFQNPGTTIDETGKVFAHIEIYAEFPPENWEQMKFVARNLNDGSITEATGEWLYGEASTFQGAVVGNLSPNTAHELSAYAVNENNIAGIWATPVAWTSPSDSTVPGTVTWYNPSQGTGRTIELFWVTLTDADLSGYTIQRETTGQGNWTTLAELDLVTHHTDTFNINYGTSYSYRIQGKDSSGNIGPWSTSNSITPVANIGNPDGDTNNPFDADTMITNQMTAKEIRTSSGSPRIEINWGLDNEIEIFDPSNNLIGDFGWIPESGDFTVMTLGNNTFNHYCLYAQNSSSTIPAAYFYQHGNGPTVDIAGQGKPILQLTSVGIFNQALDAYGDVRILGADLEIDNARFSCPSSTCSLYSVTFEVVNGWVITRDNLACYDQLYVGWTGVGTNAIRFNRETNNMKVYAPNSTTNWVEFDFVNRRFNWQ